MIINPTPPPDDSQPRTAAVLIERGHLLLDDVPGIGKTLVAKALARSLAADFKRVQNPVETAFLRAPRCHRFDKWARLSRISRA